MRGSSTFDMSKYRCEEDLLRDERYLRGLLPNATHIIKVKIPNGEKYKDTALDSKKVFNESQKYGRFAINDWLSIGEGVPEVNNGNKVGMQNGFRHNNDCRYFILDLSLNNKNVAEEIKHLNVKLLDKDREVESVDEINSDFCFPTYEIKLRKMS